MIHSATFSQIGRGSRSRSSSGLQRRHDGLAADIDAPGLRRAPDAEESHAGMANGTDGLDSGTALQFELSRGVYQFG